MNEMKPWYQSRSIWGGIVALAAAIAGLFGVSLDAATHEALAAALTSAAAAIGAVVAILGRLAAQKTLR
jgi:protein-S-isoprenylcysteine O-methyltransferase Ste14